MRVCFLTTSFPRSAEDTAGIFVYRLAKCLARAGIEITVVAPGDANAKNQEMLDGILVRRFTYFLPEKLQKVAYRWGIPENLRSNWTIAFQLPMFMVSFIWAAMICARNCDVIHAHWIPSGLAGLLVSKLVHKPLVVTIWGTDIRALPAWLSKMVLGNADEVIIASTEMEERTRALNISGKSVQISAIDEDMFNPQIDISPVINEFGLDKTHHIVSFIGRLYEFKDPITYVEAIPLVLRKKQNVKFFLVGDGALRPKLEQMISHLNLRNHVFLTGMRSDVNRILGVSDILVSISPVESWNITVIEAIYMQVPCILTDAGHTKEILTHEEDCYLIQPRDPENLATAIVLLLEDPSLRSSLAEQACYLCQEHGYTNSQIAAGHMDIYIDVVNNN